MIKRSDKEMSALQDMREHIKKLLSVDFEGQSLDMRVNSIMASITLIFDAHKCHIDEPQKPSMMDIMGGSGP